MIYLEDNTSTVSKLIENQFPYYVQENTPKFLKFLTSYYESQEGQYQPFDIASNLLDYYSISYYRPNRLTENTVLTGNLSNSSTTVSVKSTQGFPHKNGYIKIGNEIIFYRDKTATSFTNCVRGSKALVLDNIPKSHLTLTTSTAAEHLSSLSTTKVINLAYYFANEFVDRIKKEIAPFIPEVLDSELDLGGFLGKIKSFYLSKGSLNSHRTLFRILFNDRKFNIKLKNRGKGAVIKVDNIGGVCNISTIPQSGGTEWDHRKVGGELLNPPIVEVFGTGRGTVVNNIRPNATAKITVTDIRASDGAITTVRLDDAGEGYVGPITARVRPKRFKQDEIVINQTGTGVGKVEYHDTFNEELTLYEVVGYFSPDDDIYVANQGEQARAYIARTPFRTRTVSGVEIQGEQQEIEFPREYTFKTSASDYIDRKIIRCKILGASQSALPAAFSLKQDADTLFGVKGVEIEADNQKTLSEDIFEIEVSTNTDLHDIYLQPSTLTTRAFNISSDTILTVDDASRFPLTNGIIRIGDNELKYTSRSINQFFGCTGSGINVPARTEIISFGRRKYDVQWASNQVIKKDEYRYYGNNLYIAVTSGTTGSTAPTHTTGNKADGSIITTPPAVTWRFFSKNRFDHSFYIDNANKPRFQILGMPGDVLVTDGGALHTDTSYEFSRLDSPNSDYYNFTTNELSDRLAVVLGSNVNRTREVVTNNTFPSYGSLYGFNNQYDYGDHVYVASSGIPRWWNDIGTNSKKIAFQDQKIVQRWKKSSLISDTQAVGPKEKTKKLIGLNIDGIQINSYKGSTIEYGAMNKFYISNGGTYPVPYDSTGLKVDLEKLPKFDVTGTNESGTSTTITLSNSTDKLIRLSSSIKSINFNNLVKQYLSDGVTANPFYGKLSGYQSKPIIEVINNNPQIKLNFTNFDAINEFTDVLTYPLHELSTGDRVTYTANDDYFDDITPGEDYYIRKISSNSFTLHATESNALLNAEILSMYSEKRFAVGLTPQFSFKTQIYNPAGFKPAVIDISYANGNIDNLIIVESGSGYVEVPTIRISGGGKTDHVDVPYQISDNRMIEMSGSLLSYDNFNKTNSNEIDVPTTATQKFTKQPTIKISDGKDATATAYVANGALFNIVITNPGENYFIPPAITLSGGGGTGGVIRAETSATGQITRFIIVNKGTGYTTTPRIVITPLGVNGGVTARLKEWTFNMVRRLKKDDRLDTYGGYVYDSGDVKPSTDNVRGFNHLTYKLDFPKDINEKQYYLMQGADRLTARYIYEKNVGNARSAVITSSVDSSLISALNPTGSKPFKVWADANSNYLTQLFALPVHTPVMGVSYDGIPFYSGKKVYKKRNDSSSPLTELKSQYVLRYTDSTDPSDTGRIQVTADDGSTKYVLPTREGGPSITEYPIGTFIEDYYYEAPPSIDAKDRLDKHNGRFGVTPDFPEGRYCYFITTQSVDGITNQLITASSVASNGFPYFIGDTFAGECDGYMNVQARTNDRIPKSFTRANEKQINEIPKLVNGYKQFYGLPANNEYPQEDTRLNRSIAKTAETTQGTVDSVIIEAKGDGYQIGDRVIVDNTLTYGSDFSAFVSRIIGKDLRKKTDGSLELQKSADNLTVTFETNQPHGLAIGDYVYFDYDQPIDPNTGTLDLVEVTLNNAGGVVSSQINKLDNVQVSIRTGESIDSFANKEIYALNLNSKYKYKINTPVIDSVSIWYEIDQVNEWFQVADTIGNSIELDASKIPDTLYLTTGNYIYVINKVNDYKGSHIVTDIDSGNNRFTIKFAGSTIDYSDTGLYYAAKSNSATGPIDSISISSEGFGYRLLPEVSKIVKKGDPDTIAGDGKAIIQTNSNTIGRLRNVVYSSIGTGFTCNENVNYYLNLPATAKIINNFEISDITILDDPNGVNPTGGKEYDNVPKILVNNVVADGTDASIGNANIKATVAYGTITKIEVISGGAGFEKEPTITISSVNGSGALLKASIRRKRLITGNKLTGSINSQIFPIPIEATIVSFSEKTSTLVFNENAGQFNADSDKNVLYTSDGLIYGKITSIRRSKAYAKVNPYGRLEKTRKDIVGNPSENLQRVLDSHYYQDWSYSLTTSRDTKEWMDKQDVNTHPAGFKQFGRKLIAKRNNVFDNPADVFASSVIFKTTLSEELDLKVGLTKCYTQTAIFGGTGNFSVGDYVIGLTSKTIARILDVGEYFVKFMVRSGPGFQIGELVLTIPDAYAFTLPDSDATDKNLIFWEGIWQEPKHSYTIANDPNLTFPAVGAETFVPNFAVTNGDEIFYYHPNVNKFDILDSQTLTTTGTTLSFTKGGNSYAISNLGKVMISIGGAVQNPASMTVSNNTVNLGASPSDDSRVFAVGHQNLNSLTFSGSAGTQFTMNYTPSSNCKLLVFFTSVFETHLVPASNYSVSGNVITFSETVNPADIFGWYLDEDTTCAIVNTATWNDNQIQGILGCTTKRFNHHIESNASKTPDALYELRARNISGTVYGTGTNSVRGFDTRFTYTSPSHSSSFVEVLEPITFNGSTKTFTLKRNGVNYSPTNGEESLVVYLDNAVLDHDKYTIVGQQIIFTDAYASTVKCTLIDYVSSYLSNTDDGRGAILDRLGQDQTGTRVQWNLADKGVPQYVANLTDIFVIENNLLLEPSTSNYSITGNLITFVDPPLTTDNIKIPFFNRQLVPTSTNNVVLDKFRCINGERVYFPITSNGILIAPALEKHFFVIRNGVMQRPGTDYTVSASNKAITFSTAPAIGEIMFSYYSYDGVNQNIMLDDLTGFNGSTATFNLTHSSGTAFTPPDVDDLMVVRNGVVQNPTQDWTVSGSQITFTTAPANSEQLWILYTHGSQELTIASQSAVNSNSWKITMSASPGSSAADYRRLLVHVDGAPRFFDRSDFTVSGNDIILDHTGSPAPTNVFVVKIPSITQVDEFDDCPDGTRKRFKLFTGNSNLSSPTAINLVPSEVVTDADVLVSINGIVQDPGTDYSLTANRGFIDFVSAPASTDKIFMVKMSNNLHRSLTASGSNYTLSTGQSAASGERDNIVVFSNNTWKFAELGDFTWVNDTTITLATAHTTGKLFAIKFTSIFKLLDQLNQTFTNTGKVFNLYDGRKRFTPTTATYTPANGNLVLTIPNHGLLQNADVRIEPNSLKFKCNMDSGYAIKSYPRTTDPKYNTNINIDAVTTDTITLNVGTSPLVNYTPGNNTTYDPTTGNLVLHIGTTGANALSVGESIKLADSAVTFTCGADYNQSNHSYPRTTIDIKTPEAGTTYNPTTGIVTIKITNHGFNDGDLIKLNDGALKFTCLQGSGQYVYPRPTDRIGGGKWVPISNLTTDTFDIQVLDSAPSTNTTAHTFVSAVQSSLSRKRDRSYDAPVTITAKDAAAGTITVNVGKSSDTTTHTFVANSGVANSVITGGNYTHTFVSANPRCILSAGDQKIFTPVGTVDNDNVPDETSLLVVKNGKILDPKVDFTLSGDNKTQITLTDDPATNDVISVRSVGSFDKLDTITNQSNITELVINKSSASYYPNAHIERPRNWENQYLVIKDGNPLSPLYDYYVTDNKMYFTSAQTFTKLVILDFRGTADDVKVLSRGYEVVIGDELQITGEVDPSTKEPVARTISGIVSPTVLTTQSFTGDNIFTWGTGNLGSTTISNGVISALTTTSGSVGFKNPVVLRTEGTGLGAKATATVNIISGGEIVNSSIDIQYPGYNVYNTHKVFPTVYASTYKKQAVSKTEVRKGTKLTSNINNSVETIALKNTANMTSNTPTFTITGTHSGSNASFRPFISGGEVKKVEIISGGTGYDDRDINITLTGGGGTGCVLEPVLNSSGTVTSITVKNPGVGYDTFRVILRKEVSNVVNAEIVEYTTVTSTGIEGCTRAVLGTAQSYSANDLVYFDNYI